MFIYFANNVYYFYVLNKLPYLIDNRKSYEISDSTRVCLSLHPKVAFIAPAYAPTVLDVPRLGVPANNCDRMIGRCGAVGVLINSVQKVFKCQIFRINGRINWPKLVKNSLNVFVGQDFRLAVDMEQIAARTIIIDRPQFRLFRLDTTSSIRD